MSEKKILQSLDNWIPKSNDITTSKTVCGLRFSRSGALLAVPKKDGVSVLDRDNSWQEKFGLASERLADGEIVTCVDFSKDDAFVVAGTSKVS